jgi:hypothetical protein
MTVILACNNSREHLNRVTCRFTGKPEVILD